jgi:hypothetical protein
MIRKFQSALSNAYQALAAGQDAMVMAKDTKKCYKMPHLWFVIREVHEGLSQKNGLF